jgi:hypothetical protein
MPTKSHIYTITVHSVKPGEELVTAQPVIRSVDQLDVREVLEHVQREP